MELTWGGIAAIGSGVAAITLLLGYALKLVRFVDRQREQDTDIRLMKEEQQLLTYGILACLKGLHEQGCNGPVTDAISRIEKHLNRRAHQ